MLTETYNAYLLEISKFIPKSRIHTDELRLLTWGTDAGFYRLLPKIIIQSANEEEVSRLLCLSDQYNIPVTFRAAGTSLSGQSISDSVLIVAGKHWEKYSISNDAQTITLQPGIIGERVNQLLKPYGRKFSPDPASIKSAMVGGIVINNASGMNCGTHANSDRMLESVRIIFPDGTILDTGDKISRTVFSAKKPELIDTIIRIKEEIGQNRKIAERIRHKYSIKNVMGLNLLPFIMYDDPFDIITHLIVGSEGTLAFLSSATMKTEIDYPFRASAMLYFSNIKEACRAVVAMREGPVMGAELLDWKSLKSVNDTTGEGLTAVLTETKAQTEDKLKAQIKEIESLLQPFATYCPVRFTDKKEEYSKYWAIRSGIFPSVGGTREPGTTCLIEDVAFHIQDLPDAAADLQELIARHGYDDACIYGHALEGNFHFIINQSFDTQEKVKRYEDLMSDVILLVIDKYDGSLKAEHGTGRNMAPFVSYEWGEDIFRIMKEIKDIFDPKALLNPGVIFNDDPECHIKNFKPLPLTNPHVDKCIECGFCEVNCLTHGLTLSSRQRIIAQREITRLKAISGEQERMKALIEQYKYYGNATCAGDGLCATSCPMNINVGDLTHDIRNAELSSTAKQAGEFAANHLAGIKNILRSLLSIASVSQTILGDRAMTAIGNGLHNILNIPLWTTSMPRANRVRIPRQEPMELKVVYFPSCINQAMGQSKHDPDPTPLPDKMTGLLRKAGYEVIFPENMDSLCCGTIWESKGMPEQADKKASELEAALLKASENGKYPVLCDQSPCLYRMRHTIKQVRLYEPAEFIFTFLKDRLEFTPTDTPVMIHITCTMQKMGLEDVITKLAKLCSTHVLIPEEVGCCGFAGDKGFTHPEVNAYALRKLRPQIERESIPIGYSNSRTCEIGLATNAHIPYMSIVYLVDQCTKSHIE